MFLPNRPSIPSSHNQTFYGILKILTRGHLLRVEEGSLYPALQRLELNGLVEGQWGLSATNRWARFYTLTPDGRNHLNAEAARYRQVTRAVVRIMRRRTESLAI